MADEFEIKSRADPVVVAKVERVANFGAPTKMVDVYWDTQRHDFFRNAAFIRVRDGRTVEVKHNLGIESVAHLHSKERSWKLPLSAQARKEACDLARAILGKDGGLLAVSDLTEFVVIDKTRRVGHVGHVVIAHDHIDGLGDFLEFEVESAQDVPALRALSREYGLTNIPIGYVEMFLRESDPALYLEGRFVLPEDLHTP